jgi:hypothetical protein
MAAKGQNGGDCEKSETTMGWTCEGRCKGVEKSPRLLGQLLVIPVEDASSLARLLRLLVPEDAELFLGHALAGLTGYTGHGSLLSEMKYVAYTCHLTKEAGLKKTPRKGQKWN